MIIYTNRDNEKSSQKQAMEKLLPLVESGELILVDARIQVFGKETSTTMIVANERATEALKGLRITVFPLKDSSDLKGFDTSVSASGLEAKLGTQYRELVKALNDKANGKANLDMPEQESSRSFKLA